MGADNKITAKELVTLQEKSIVFYDGSCGFCQSSVQLALKYNKAGDLHFAALQSGLAEKLVPGAAGTAPLPDSIVFYEKGQLYLESEAVLRIARHLIFPWPLLYSFRFIPLSFRNFLYRLVARNRYRIAGRTEACLLPSPEERARFVA